MHKTKIFCGNGPRRFGLRAQWDTCRQNLTSFSLRGPTLWNCAPLAFSQLVHPGDAEEDGMDGWDGAMNQHHIYPDIAFLAIGMKRSLL